MIGSFRHLAAVALLVSPLLATGASGSALSADDWSAYKDRFVAGDGRVVDDGNGGISHSEGQGYGLLLAVLAGDEAGFDQIWTFTRTELMLRDDGLVMWKWDPEAEPHVSDPNNATDGDILIAYALARAGERWEREDLTQAASALANAISAVVVEQGGRRVILPGKDGYGPDERPDGPVVNLSYWIFEAFPVLSALAPDAGWERIGADGRSLLGQSLFGERRLPPEWLSIESRPRPARGFPAEFGYNAIRIPLYLLRAGITDETLLRPLAEGMTGEDGAVVLSDLPAGSISYTLNDAGYRILPALVSCVLDGTPLPEDLRRFQPTLYYPSTLHLLSLSFLAESRPECVR